MPDTTSTTSLLVAHSLVRTYAAAKGVQSLTDWIPAPRCARCSSADVCWDAAPAQCLGHVGEPLCDDCADAVWCEHEDTLPEGTYAARNGRHDYPVTVWICCDCGEEVA